MVVVMVGWLAVAIRDECAGAGRVAVLAVAAMASAQAGGALVGDLGGVRQAGAAARPLPDRAIDVRRGDDPFRILDHQLVSCLVDLKVRDHITGADDHAPSSLFTPTSPTDATGNAAGQSHSSGVPNTDRRPSLTHQEPKRSANPPMM